MTTSRKEKVKITPELIREYFKYEDGHLIRIKPTAYCTKVGNIAGNIGGHGRLQVQFFNSSHLVHRLIWIMHNGHIPVGMEIDHIDQNPLNNKIQNLRLASKRENLMNNRRTKSGFPGVYYVGGKNGWAAKIYYNKKLRNIGQYHTLEEAVAARRKAEEELGIEVREEFHQAS